jgi:hypothetical protein
MKMTNLLPKQDLLNYVVSRRIFLKQSVLISLASLLPLSWIWHHIWKTNSSHRKVVLNWRTPDGRTYTKSYLRTG